MITKDINTIALSEVYYIISNLEEKYKNKIPSYIINNMVKYIDKEYQYIQDKELLPESKALLAVLIEKYFGDEEFNKKIKEYNQYYELKCNEIKQKRYSANKIFANQQANDSTEKKTTEGGCTLSEGDEVVEGINANLKEEVALVPISKDKWYKKLLSFFKNIFNK